MPVEKAPIEEVFEGCLAAFEVALVAACQNILRNRQYFYAYKQHEHVIVSSQYIEAAKDKKISAKYSATWAPTFCISLPINKTYNNEQPVIKVLNQRE